MKTTELIKLLQEIDPSGTSEVCVANEGIAYLEHLASYYDGRLQSVSKRNEYGHPIESTIKANGGKIVIHTVDLSEMYINSILYYCKEYPIEYDMKSWLSSEWDGQKMMWLQEARVILPIINEIDNISDKENKTILFIESLEKRLSEGNKKEVLESFLKHCKSDKQKESMLRLTDMLYSIPKMILKSPSWGKDYVVLPIHSF